MVYPYISSQFGDLSLEGVVNVLNTDFYTQDYLGLKALHNANKVSFVHIENSHLVYSMTDAMDMFKFMFDEDYTNLK